MKCLVPAACLILGFALVFSCGCSCSKKEEPPPEKEPPVEQVSFDRKDEVVSEKEFKDEDTQQSVEADFNLDGLADLALVRRLNDKENAVEILIRKNSQSESSRSPAGKPAVQSATVKPSNSISRKDEATVEYYRAGTIRWSAEGKIIGIATRSRKEYSDIVLIISHAEPGKGNDVIHYKNDGRGFVQATK